VTATNITIVTAFFDIGRGGWNNSVQKNGGPLPHYLERNNDVYIERFSNMCALDNDIIVFTSPDIAPRLEAIAANRIHRTVVVPFDLIAKFSDKRARIRAVMDDPAFIQKINPAQRRNPEYWSEDYVLVTGLKAYFVATAIENNLVNTEQVAWIDFGYCRTPATLAGKTSWKHEFDSTKIHFWNCQIPNLESPDTEIARAVIDNSVIIFGAMVVAHRSYWRPLAEGMDHSLNNLIANGLVDDDQGLWLMCYFGNPNIFQLHPLDYNNPFIVFENFND
jgi:protein YibB